MKIRTKITLFYLLLLIFSIIVSNFLYQKIYADITSHKVGQVSLQMLQSINKNVDSVIDMVNAQSKAILSNNDIQELLNSPQKAADLNFKRKITMSLFGFKEAAPLIAGIYLFDNKGSKLPGPPRLQPVQFHQHLRLGEARPVPPHRQADLELQPRRPVGVMWQIM